MVTNAGLIAGLIAALAFLFAGWTILQRAAPVSGASIMVGAIVFLAAQLYGLIVLKPYIGRTFDEHWYQQTGAVEVFGIFGLLVCAAGVVAHALGLARR